MIGRLHQRDSASDVRHVSSTESHDKAAYDPFPNPASSSLEPDFQKPLAVLNQRQSHARTVQARNQNASAPEHHERSRDVGRHAAKGEVKESRREVHSGSRSSSASSVRSYRSRQIPDFNRGRDSTTTSSSPRHDHSDRGQPRPHHGYHSDSQQPQHLQTRRVTLPSTTVTVAAGISAIGAGGPTCKFTENFDLDVHTVVRGTRVESART